MFSASLRAGMTTESLTRRSATTTPGRIARRNSAPRRVAGPAAECGKTAGRHARPGHRRRRASSARSSSTACWPRGTPCACSTTSTRRSIPTAARRTCRRTSSSCVGDVRDRAAVRRRARRASTRSSTAPRRSASASRSTRWSTTSTSTSRGTATLLDCLAGAASRLPKLLVLHVDDRLRRGPLPPAVGRRACCASPSAARTTSRATAGSRSARRPASRSRPCPRPRTRRCWRATSTRSPSASRRSWRSALGARLRLSGRLPAALQRLRAASVAEQSVHRRAGDLPRAAARRASGRWSTRTAARPATSSRCTTSPRPRSRRSSTDEADGAVLNIGSGVAAARSATSRRTLAHADRPRRPRSRDVTGQFRRGDVRHCTADIARARAGCSASRRASSGRTGSPSWSPGAATPPPPTTSRARTASSSAAAC